MDDDRFVFGPPEYVETQRTWEEMKTPEISLTKLTDGLGYGDGDISGDEAFNSMTDDESMMLEDALNSPEIVTPVDTDKDGKPLDDDGCGDGRLWVRILEGTKERFKSLTRSKVFGGGLTMGVASAIGLGKARGKKLQEVFSFTAGRMMAKGINFGGHTDDGEHKHDGKCGCGAIDRSPEIIDNVVKYRDKIGESISALGMEDDCLDEIFDEYQAFAEENRDLAFSGAAVMKNNIVASQKVTKKLTGKHREGMIILNTVEGMTVNQELIRRVTNDKVQVFAVDVWRMQDIADRVADNPEDRKRAFLSQLVYTLGVAATLTAGDLPVYLATNKQFANAA